MNARSRSACPVWLIPIPSPCRRQRRPCLAGMLLLLVAVTILLAACGGATSSPTVAPTPTSAPTVPPSATPTPAPTALPSATPTPAPTATPTPIPVAELAGRILDQDSARPLAGAVVSAGGRSVTTADDGRFAFLDLAPGGYTLLVTHPDYDPFLSSILTLIPGAAPALDIGLTPTGVTALPPDPMTTNQVDAAGAPTAADAERLARLQGFQGPVASIGETVLEGRYLVNYRSSDSFRAALATLHHPAWELVDSYGGSWYIIRICGNLALAAPSGVSFPAQLASTPLPVVTVGAEALSGYACASDACEVLATLPAGWHGSVAACAGGCEWLRVRGEGCPGGCWIRRQGCQVFGDMARLPTVPGGIEWSVPAAISPSGHGGPTQQLLLDRSGTLWAFWEENVQGNPGQAWSAVHYTTWNGQEWGPVRDIPGSYDCGEPVATILADGDLLVRADTDLTKKTPRRVWFRWHAGRWTSVPEMSLSVALSGGVGELAADGFGNVFTLADGSFRWDGSSWHEAEELSYHMPNSATALDSQGNLHVIKEATGIVHRVWDGQTWTAGERVYVPPAAEDAQSPVLAIGPDDVIHAVWVASPSTTTGFAPEQRWILYSRRTASGWTAPQTIMGPAEDDSTWPWFPGIMVLPDGLIVVVWSEVGVSPRSAVLAVWGDGQTWSKPVVLASSETTDLLWPSIEADSDGNIHVIWVPRDWQPVQHVVGKRR